MLETFKALTNVTNDAIAQYYLDKAKRRIMDYTKRNSSTVANKLSTYVIDLAIVYYNAKGAEGLKTQSYSGMSESYIEDIPADIKRNLNGYRWFSQETEVSTP